MFSNFEFVGGSNTYYKRDIFGETSSSSICNLSLTVNAKVASQHFLRILEDKHHFLMVTIFILSSTLPVEEPDVQNTVLGCW